MLNLVLLYQLLVVDTSGYEKGFLDDEGKIHRIRYEIIKDKKYTYREAEEDAKKRGGHLATIVSEQEHKAVMEAFEANKADASRAGGN